MCSSRGADQRLFVLSLADRHFVFDARTNAVTEVGTADRPAELVDVDPTGQRVAWVRDNNLYLLGDVTEPPQALTRDGTDNILNGKLDWVYQEELYGRGNFKGFWWAPDGQSIAWLRTDERPVLKYSVMDHLPVRGQLETTAYPKAGDPLPAVTMHVFQVPTGHQVDFPVPGIGAATGEEKLISRVTWDATNLTLLVQIQNRIQSWLDLYRFDPSSGAVTLLFRDQTEAWIESPGDPVILDDGSLLWLSPRSGFNAIWHYSGDGQVIRQLTTDPWEVRELLGCDLKNGKVYFTGSPETPVRVVPMSIPLNGGQPGRLTRESGCQSASFNRDFSYFLCQSGTATTPDSISLRKADGSLVRVLVPGQFDRLRHLDIVDPEFITLPVDADGVPGELDAMLIKPAGFDPGIKYPVVVHVYGGPRTPRVRDRFDGQRYLWHQYLAQQGFVVFIVDTRSSSWRSSRQRWPIYRNLARHELADLEQAVGWLTCRPWVDAQRIGLWGWSYGGYLTACAMTHCHLFSAGIAGAPVTDWKNYDAIYTERYMGMPQDNPDGYASSSVLPAAGNLQGQLLLIHGTVDDNVHLSNTLQLAWQLQKAGKQFQLMVYPGNRHSIRDPEQQLHLYQMMTDFFTDNL